MNHIAGLTPRWWSLVWWSLLIALAVDGVKIWITEVELDCADFLVFVSVWTMSTGIPARFRDLGALPGRPPRTPGSCVISGARVLLTTLAMTVSGVILWTNQYSFFRLRAFWICSLMGALGLLLIWSVLRFGSLEPQSTTVNRVSRQPNWIRVWELFAFILPPDVREKVFEPARADLLWCFAERKRYRTKWARRWIDFTLVFRTVILILECLALIVPDRLIRVLKA